MKIPSTSLFDLLKSLTKSEKRYIKVQSGVGDKDYLRLMDALLGQAEYDESKLMRSHAGDRFLKNLPVNKRYLYELILESLRRFGEEKVEGKIFKRISAANVLIGKGLLKDAYSELKKGKKVAQRFELYELQIMILGIEKRLLSLSQFKSAGNENIHEIFLVETNCLEQLRNTNEYWYLAKKVAQFQIRFQKVQNEEQQKDFEALIKNPKLQNLAMATNFKSKVFFFQANATCEFMLGSVERAYEFNSRFLSLLEENPDFLKLYADRYLVTLNNMLIDSLIIGKNEILEEGINRLAMIVERPEFRSMKNRESRVFRQQYLLLLNWSLSRQEFSKALDLVPQIEEGLERFGKKIEKHHRITFRYLITYIYFQNGLFEEALEWNDKILNDNKEDVVKELFYFARTLNVLIQFELGNFELLESLLISTPKYLKARRSVYSTEKVLFRFLRKLSNCVDGKDEAKLMHEFKGKLKKLAENPKEQRVFACIDLVYWLNSRSK